MQTKPLWMRRKPVLNREPELYHLCRDGSPTLDTHYFYTLCHKEIKGIYWQITTDPKEEECCPECLMIVKGGDK